MIADEPMLPIARKCAIMNVSRSGYYDWRQREVSRRELANQDLDAQIQTIYHNHAGRYGYRRICEELRDMGICASLERVRRRMKRLNLKGIQHRKFKHTTNSKHNLPIMPNLLEQNFSADQANQVWVADITYIRTVKGFCYLALITDLFSRKIVGYNISDTLELTGCLGAFKRAQKAARPAAGLIHHSDRGVQYCSNQYVNELKKHKVEISMTEENHCYENAVAERVNGILKDEFYLDQCFFDTEKAKLATKSAIKLYNNKRLHLSLGYKTPNEVFVANIN
jgi:transposase InsO family protein